MSQSPRSFARLTASARRQVLSAAVLLCTVPLLGASCLSSGDSDTGTTSRRDDLSDSRIPSNARKVAEGRGALSYRATANGRVYLYDATDRNVLFTDDLLEGDSLTISPGDDRVAINGRSGEKVRLVSENTHRIYFDGRRTGTGVGGSTRDDRDRLDRDRLDRDRTGRDDDLRDRDTRDVSRAVPDDARVVAESRGGELSYKADDDGRAYLYDATESKLVKTYAVRRGQRLTISPANGLVAIDGKTIAQNQEFNRRSNYRLLFAR
ncbi:MAG TPA: hypothetical protein VF624_02345 [Tepidisphaeraceae bacterium]|jgi:hypothetical protein